MPRLLPINIATGPRRPLPRDFGESLGRALHPTLPISHGVSQDPPYDRQRVASVHSRHVTSMLEKVAQQGIFVSPPRIRFLVSCILEHSIVHYAPSILEITGPRGKSVVALVPACTSGGMSINTGRTEVADQLR